MNAANEKKVVIITPHRENSRSCTCSRWITVRRRWVAVPAIASHEVLAGVRRVEEAERLWERDRAAKELAQKTLAMIFGTLYRCDSSQNVFYFSHPQLTTIHRREMKMKKKWVYISTYISVHAGWGRGLESSLGLSVRIPLCKRDGNAYTRIIESGPWTITITVYSRANGIDGWMD